MNIDINKELKNASRLKNLGNYSQAVELYDKLYRESPDEFQLRDRMNYAWSIYRCSVQNSKDEADLFQSVEFITSIVPQLDLNIRANANSCAYTSSVFRVLTVLKNDNDYYNMPYWLEKINPKLLDEKPFRKYGRINKSKKEKFYDIASKAYLECGDYEECVRVSKEALDTFKSFRDDGDAWHCWRIGKSLNRLGEYEESLFYLKEAVSVKKEWYIYREIADSYYNLSKPLEAMEWLYPAILSNVPLNTKVNAYYLMYNILKGFNIDAAMKHAELFYLIKHERGYMIPDDIERLNINPDNLDKKTLDREIRDIWTIYQHKNEKLQHGTVTRFIEDKNYGFIKSENGESLFFHKSEFRDDAVFVGQMVSFYTEKSFDKSKNRESTKAVFIRGVQK